MLMQSSLPSSIEAAIFHVSDKGKEDAPCDRMPSAETWQVCLKCKKYPLYCCRKVEAMQEQEDRRNDVPCCREVEAMQVQEVRRNDDVPCCREVEAMQEQEDRMSIDVPCCREVDVMQEQEYSMNVDVPCCREFEARQEQEYRMNVNVPCCRKVEAMQKVEDRRNDDVPCCRKVEAMQEAEDRRNYDVPCYRKAEAMQEVEDRRNDDVPCCRKVEAMQEVEDRRNDDVPCSSNCISSLDRPTASTMTGNTLPNIVYRRKKLRNNSTAPLLKVGPMSVPANANCPSFISLCANKSSLERQPPSSQVEQDIAMVKDLVSPIVLCETAIDKSIPKNLGIESINDSCSSSKSIMEIVPDSIETRGDDTGECSSSSVLVTDVSREDLSAKDFCIEVLRSLGLLGGDALADTVASQTQAAASGDSFSSRSCKICDHLGGSSNMLICDHCEQAYHPSCIIPRMKKLPIDEWFCHSCIKKKQKILKEKIIGSSLTINSEKNSSCNGGLNPILLMLNDSGPSTSGVRVGKGFQAEVPEWSGPIGSDDDCAEQLEIDFSEFLSFQEKNFKRASRLSSICNWLQCQEVVDRAKGTICGKWRRAPLFEVQTDNWECFCAIPWDPAHADCAVPQELETDQVQKQVKYIEMLKPRLAARHSKLDSKKGRK